MKKFVKFGLLSVASSLSITAQANNDSNAIVENYANIAYANYSESLAGALKLKSAILQFTESPSPETLQNARENWIAARVSYQQTEAFRFANPLVDNWEGKVNAWPLDEGLIDYVAADYQPLENPLGLANLISVNELSIGPESLDLTNITPDLIASLHEVGGIETNVAAGYHAIEFLLWGQDLNGYSQGSGSRQYSDYLQNGECTNAPCDRRATYLNSAAQLLVTDLEYIVSAWAENGEARSDISNDENPISRIVFGLGSLSYGELAGERMKLGLLLNDPEEEHDCFSDNTHNSHYYDLVGIHNVYYGEYAGIANHVKGASIAQLVRDTNTDLADQTDAQFREALVAFSAVKAAAEAGESYDSMLSPDNLIGNQRIERAIEALVNLSAQFSAIAQTLELNTPDFEGSDSLDNPDAVI